MASADPAEDDQDAADDAPEETEAGVADRPCLEQRFTPWLQVRTTIHPQGLVVEVNRLFNQRVAAVDFDRLVLEPAAVVKLRREYLWVAASGFTAGLLLTTPLLQTLVPEWVSVLCLALSALAAFVAAISPRRVTMFLDREQVLHPIFLRSRPDEPQVAEFVDAVSRAAVAWRCRPPATEDDDAAPRRPRLADTLDALLTMRQEELITDGELQRFREMAQRR